MDSLMYSKNKNCNKFLSSLFFHVWVFLVQQFDWNISYIAKMVQSNRLLIASINATASITQWNPKLAPNFY
jgi:hypothetical protein